VTSKPHVGFLVELVQTEDIALFAAKLASRGDTVVDVAMQGQFSFFVRLVIRLDRS